MPVHDDAVLRDMAQQLLGAMSEDTVVDKELLAAAENLIVSHHFYVQLLYIDLIIERMRNIRDYFSTLDSLLEDLAIEDIAEMQPKDKARLLQTLVVAVKTQLEIVNSTIASKETSGALTASLRESFHVPDGLDVDDASADDGVLDLLRGLPPSQRQTILKGAIQALRNMARKGQGNQ